MRLRYRFALAIAFVIVAATPAWSDSVPEPDGYRMGRFRAPTPATLRGGTVVSTREVEALAASGDVVLVDVMPRPPRPQGLAEGTVWRPKARYNIPGSAWLANTGFGALGDDAERYFRDSLARLTANDTGRRLLFYCLADCWMSWNAAKRAIAYGYTEVYWYPEGTDGWEAADLPTEKSEPVPMTGE